MKVDVVASEPHYLEHLLPIWHALPDAMKGTDHPLVEPGYVTRPPMGRVAMVAGWQDVAPLRGQCQMIYVEHGAGQQYVDRLHDPSYSGSGGARHQGVIGYIAPSETVAARWSNAPAVAVGCPKMDHWLQQPPKTPLATPVVCFLWHWDCKVSQESRSAYAHYREALPLMADWFNDQGWAVAMHTHPKWRGTLDEELGRFFDFFTADEVFARADVLMFDNSSMGYEFASLGRPVVCLNAPWYRREVDHGLRFWEFAPGIEVHEPDELLAFNLWDLLNDTPTRQVNEFRRVKAVEHAYAFTDGKAAERAAAWIATLLSGM